ncbi:hypothetical protein EVAR_62108_1 [Eumeta japonica]|uniref:Uncharacterized protein n=1 Tax=Eumeta variegata TaxID=151549 RepID=A0A4C1Z4W6_EUMVA|nr:hypothetical protein EVAR_62108_1 [Eumeta japonica]
MSERFKVTKFEEPSGKTYKNYGATSADGDMELTGKLLANSVANRIFGSLQSLGIHCWTQASSLDSRDYDYGPPVTIVARYLDQVVDSPGRRPSHAATPARGHHPSIILLQRLSVLPAMFYPLSLKLAIL